MGVFISTSSEDRVFMAAKGGIVVLSQGYRDLSDKGKFEVILFNSSFAIWLYNRNHPTTPLNNVKYATKIVKQARNYNIKMSDDSLMNFFINRLTFYVNEYNQLPEDDNIPGKIYSNFYINPLAAHPEPSFDLGEIIQFKMALVAMIKWVKDGIYKI